MSTLFLVLSEQRQVPKYPTSHTNSCHGILCHSFVSWFFKNIFPNLNKDVAHFRLFYSLIKFLYGCLCKWSIKSWCTGWVWLILLHKQKSYRKIILLLVPKLRYSNIGISIINDTQPHSLKAETLKHVPLQATPQSVMSEQVFSTSRQHINS